MIMNCVMFQMAFNILSSLVKQQSLVKTFSSPPIFSAVAPFSTSSSLEMPSCRVYRKPHPVPDKVGKNPYKHKPLQVSSDWLIQ